jgi:hypothetical protein
LPGDGVVAFQVGFVDATHTHQQRGSARHGACQGAFLSDARGSAIEYIEGIFERFQATGNDESILAEPGGRHGAGFTLPLFAPGRNVVPVVFRSFATWQGGGPGGNLLPIQPGVQDQYPLVPAERMSIKSSAVQIFFRIHASRGLEHLQMGRRILMLVLVPRHGMFHYHRIAHGIEIDVPHPLGIGCDSIQIEWSGRQIHAPTGKGQ